jgi:hypothetical protein
LLVEANYTDKKEPAWRLAVKSDGRKHYLIRETTILSEHGGLDSTRELVEAVAGVLAQHTDWPVTSAQSKAAEVVRSSAERRQLPAELRGAGFRAGVDERLRQTIRLPTRGQLMFGIVLLAL